MSYPPIEGEPHHPTSPPAAASAPPAVADPAPAGAPEPAATEAPPAPDAATAYPPASAPPGWPVSGPTGYLPGSAAPYGYPPVAAVAAPRRGRATINLAVLSTLLLVGSGVLTVLYVTDRQTIAQQRTVIDSGAADLKAKSAELTRTQQDLAAAKADAQDDAACAAAGRAVSKLVRSQQVTTPQTVDPQALQAALTAMFELIKEC